MHEASDIERWAASGALALTGTPIDPPLGPPSGFVSALDRLADELAVHSAAVGQRVVVDPLDLLTERAAIGGLRRGGLASCGGATRLLPAADDWIAVALPRPDDVDLLPAWLGIDPGDDDRWTRLGEAVASRPAGGVVGAGAELGLAVGVLGETPARRPAPLAVDDARGRDDLAGVVVVDLTSLWAGPLCGSLLADAGAQVVKVESSRRPDGARGGPKPFHDLLNAGKRSVAVDFSTDDGRRRLHDVVARADVVLEASRPRALTQLGIDAAEMLRDHRPTVWLSITGHGRAGDGRHRIGFGDDAAVAGGLVAREGAAPRFLVDAIADPLTGLTGAVTVLELLRRGGSWLIDLPMAAVAAGYAGPPLPVPAGLVAADPAIRRGRGEARALGADTDAVLATTPTDHGR